MIGVKTRKRIGNFTIGTLLWIGALLILVPLALIIMTSLKTSKEAMSITVNLPETWHFENYAVVWGDGLILKGFFNSLLITVPTVTITLFCSALMSFYLARRKQRSTRALYIFTVAGIIKPVPLVTTFLFLQQIGLLNTRPGLILVLSGTLMSLAAFIYTGFIKGIPVELDDAAAIDGCGPFRTFWKVVFPLLKPCTFTVLIIITFNVWNNAQETLFFLGNSDYWTMPLNLYRFFGYYRTEWNYVFCAVFMMTLPVILTYLFGQRYIIDGMVSGSVKG